MSELRLLIVNGGPMESARDVIRRQMFPSAVDSLFLTDCMALLRRIAHLSRELCGRRQHETANAEREG